MKTADEYAEILSDLMEVNDASSILDPEMMRALAAIISQFHESALMQAVELAESGEVPMHDAMMAIPYDAPMHTFALGVLYGRRQIAEFLGE